MCVFAQRAKSIKHCPREIKVFVFSFETSFFFCIWNIFFSNFVRTVKIFFFLSSGRKIIWSLVCLYYTERANKNHYLAPKIYFNFSSSSPKRCESGCILISCHALQLSPIYLLKFAMTLLTPFLVIIV